MTKPHGSMRMIEDEVGLKEKPEDTRYIKRLHRNEKCVYTKDLITNFAIIGNDRLGNGQGRHYPKDPGMGCSPYHGAPPTIGAQGLLNC